MKNNYIVFSEDCKVLTKDNRVILINRDNGMKIKISRECHELLMEAAGLKFTEEEIMDCMESDCDKEYIKKLLGILKEYKLIKFSEEKEIKRIEKIVFEMTRRCNLKCRHCSVDASSNSNDEELSTDAAKDVLRKIGAYNSSTLVLSGGEPMVKKDFFDLLIYSRKVFAGEIGLMTNGTLINEENIMHIISSVDFIDISIDGVDESSCSLLRGSGVFEKVVNCVKLLKKYNFNRISLSMVKVEGNKHLIDDFYKLNKELSTKPIIRAFADIGRGLINSSIFMVNKNDQILLDYAENDLKKYESNNKYFQALRTCVCGAGSREIMIAPNGDIYPCVLLLKPEYKITNISSIGDLGQLEGIITCGQNEAVKALKENMPENHKNCKDCNVNLFCWGCIEEFERVSSDDERFKDRCLLNKSNLEKLVWSN